MTIDIKKRIQRLAERRQNTDVLNENLLKALGGTPKLEKYRQRTNLESVQYALGSMQEVDPDYTENSVAEAARVIKQLQEGMDQKSTPVACELQGSVPLNIHIRGVSDVDILSLAREFLRADPNGARANSYLKLDGTIIERMQTLRANSESVLKAKYPTATVDISGAKSIKLSGGSLRRKIDVVPSMWFDTVEYQTSNQKYEREVGILDKDVPTMIYNRPFLYMAQINNKDSISDGGAKKVTRLLKVLRTDAEPEIDLSSYDIASLVWHMDTNSLKAPYNRELGLMIVALDHLRYWSANITTAQALNAPDGTRKILDKPEKFTAMRRLENELSELVIEVAGEVSPATKFIPSEITNVLKQVTV